MLDLAGMDYEVAIEQETLAKPVPYKVLESMRACSAAVICVTADDGVPDGSTHRVNQNVLIEIGAAFVLYDPLVVLVWDKRVEVPSNLQGLYRCEYEGEELSWESGTKLMAALVALRDAEDPDRDAAEGATG
jgi:predicted nucleotide-binding protein